MLDRTVEQQSAAGPAPASGGQVAESRPVAPPVERTDQGAQRGPAPEPGRIPESGRIAELGRGAELGRTAEPGRMGEPGRAESRGALESGRTTGADPNARPATSQTTPSHATAKGREAGPDFAALLMPPPPLEPERNQTPKAQLRAFLLTRPEARPILVLIKPGGGREPLILTGLTPCAGPLPGCAAELPATGPTTVD